MRSVVRHARCTNPYTTFPDGREWRVRTKIPDMGGAVGASAKSANSAAEGPLGTAVAHITAAANGKCASIASCQLPATGTVEQAGRQEAKER